jgi:shikimate kinase
MRTIFLIGPRASGKTSLGRILAERLGAVFCDTDAMVVARLGRSVAEHVAVYGWESFRDAETEVLKQAESACGVAACGGGIVLRRENRELLARGVVLYLAADPEVLAGRLQADPLEAQRPSLTGKDVVEEVRDVLAQRENLYREAAHLVLDAGAGLDALADEALERLAVLGADTEET